MFWKASRGAWRSLVAAVARYPPDYLEQSLPVGSVRGAQNGVIRALSGDAGHIVFAWLLGRLPRWT
jgi:hypothetical protein